MLTWADNTANEIGYRIDRKVAGSSNWKTIYYHPKISNTDPINVSNYNYTNETDVNRPELYDYYTANGAQVQYRVAAINCNDDNSAATLSNSVTLPSSIPGNVMPAAAITSPANNATFTAGSSITINANATDSDGTISKVEFYANGNKLGEDATSPYSYIWTGTVVGTYTLTAKATDNSGGTTTSSGVTVTVGASSAGVIPGKIEAESYSAMNGIQTQGTSDAGGGQNVGWIDAGDWMDYSVTVATAGTYTINYRVAAQSSGGQLILRKGGTDYHTVNIPSTGGWQNWTTVSGTATLTAGAQTLRIYASGSGWNINWFEGVTASSGGAVVHAINAGSSSSFTSTNSTVYSADVNFTGGSTSGSSGAIGNTTDDVLYQSVRFGNFSYALPVSASGNYEVTLKFNETYWTSNGKRVFDVKAEGNTIVSALDIHQTAGGRNIAYDVVRTVSVTDGVLNLQFVTLTDNAIVSGILVRNSSQGARMTGDGEEQAEMLAEVISVHPNPASDVLYITADDIKSVIIYNIQGVPVMQPATDFETLDISGLPAGMYMLKVNTSKASHTRKIVKQ